MVHPVPLTRPGQLLERAAIGPIPGWLVLGMGAVYCLGQGAIAIWSLRRDKARAQMRHDPLGMG